MKEHKSNLKALEPVEIRLAAAVRIRHEIARLSEVQQALDADAREIALSVVGRPEIVDVVLGVIGDAFSDDTEAFDQSAVEAFLAEHHDLRIGVPAAPPEGASSPAAGSSESGSASAAGAPVAPVAPAAPVPPTIQPSESATVQQHDAEPSAAEAIAARLSGYDVELPTDYFGVSFDMLKRPEADLIIGEAILAVVDGLSLDASPYKGDRGKVHWRRKLFEEAFAFFQAAPPRAKAIQTQPADVEVPVAVSDGPARIAEPPAVDAVPLQPQADHREGDRQAPPVLVPPEPQAEDRPAAATLAEAPGTAVENPAPVCEVAPVAEDASPHAEDDGQGDGSRPDEDGGAEHGLGDDTRRDEAETPLVEPVREIAGSGQVIDFPSQAAGPVSADSDHVDPFESSPPNRQAALVASIPARDPVEDGDPTDAPTYDGPEWEGPGSEADDLDRNFADRAGFDRDDDDRYGASGGTPGLDHAAAAALADAVEVPSSGPAEAPRLPVGGVPPRPAIAMPAARAVPAVPPRPAPAFPGAAASGLPPARPALAGAGDGARLAPRPVAVRPPGM